MFCYDLGNAAACLPRSASPQQISFADNADEVSSFVYNGRTAVR